MWREWNFNVNAPQADLVSEEPPKEEKEDLISAEQGSHSTGDVNISCLTYSQIQVKWPVYESWEELRLTTRTRWEMRLNHFWCSESILLELIPQRKRGWGASKSRDDSVSISSNSLKDIVPDIAPLMDNTDPFNEREEGNSVDLKSEVTETYF